MNNSYQVSSSPNLDLVRNLVQNGADVNSRDEETSTLIFMAGKKLLDMVKFLLNQGADYQVVQTVGLRAGCSLLHVACEQGQEEIVKLLLSYNPDLTLKNLYGAAPVHLAVLFKHKEVLQLLLAAGADIDAEFGEKFHKKYLQHCNWCSDFGNKMTLLSYAVISNNSEMAKLLVDGGAKVNAKSLTGKTLLMYAVERDNIEIIRLLLEKMTEDEVNARDKDGNTAIHFILHEKKYNGLRFNVYQTFLNQLKSLILKELLKKKIDVNVTVNNNPQTLLINMAAFHACPEMLTLLLVKQTSNLSEPLFYSSINPHDPKSYSANDPFIFFEHNVKKCFEQAVVDIITKCEMKLSVSKNEVKLLEDFADRSDRGKFIDECKKKVTQNLKELKFEIIQFGDDKKVSLFDILASGFVTLRKFMRSNDFMEKIVAFECDSKFDYFYELALSRLEDAKTRVNLLKECNQVFCDLQTPFPLPYEIVREIIDCIDDNQDFKSFIQAFK